MVAPHHPSRSVSVPSKITFTALLDFLHFTCRLLKFLSMNLAQKRTMDKLNRVALCAFPLSSEYGSETGLSDTPSAAFHALHWHCQQLGLIAFGEVVVAQGEPYKIE